ncbi:N-acetylmuramoyl-L-alanine amidase [Ferrovibrio sp.]|uniref:N-acetylmuramoyl-L-alanine amidase family protein n=1 Tax=Ferrovibrio sp. TaxID=1917215 RepID=UPI001B6FE1AF|nr:N-acetylmuramoyl-L-alanine amidase [Ferrovibrio sp.]MBP7066239.1 N-acetylmuramoyl-L-alanine amidase [Ferrovibrio sp.]
MIILFPASIAAAQPAQIGRISLGLNAGLTRLVLEADRPLAASLSNAPGGLELELRLENAVLALGAPQILAAGVIERLDSPASGGSLRLTLLDTAVVDRAFLLPPQGEQRHRLVIDLLPADPAAYVSAFASPVALPLTLVPVAPAVTQKAKGDNRKLIVLDPGHGGHDPGAISASGRYEKALTLGVAQALAKKLRATGRYRVVLTRERDVAVKLLDRVEFARKREADLFLSIHADSLAADRATRGASVYTRAEDATDREAEALALRENRADQLADGGNEAELDDVVAILLDLASRDTARLSRRFAGLLTSALAEQKLPLRRNGLRAANFRVLGAPDIPSALLELGYLSNPAEEAVLFSETGRNQLAEAVAEAIDRFFGAASTP